MTKTTLSTGVVQVLPKDVHRFLSPFVKIAHQLQVPAYLVGGCVRDLLLRRPSADLDVVIEGPSEEIARAVSKAMKAKWIRHPQFLTHTLVFKNGRHLDLATARVETYPECAALPIVEPASIQDDLHRRDFSVNAIALSLNENDFGHLWDPFGGIEDLKAKRIRVLHGESFRNDPTRLFRAARLAGRLGFEIEWRTREWLLDCIAQQLPARLSGARLREELVPLLMEKDPRPAMNLLNQWGALGFWVSNLNWDKSHDVLLGQLIKTTQSKGAGKENPLIPRLMAFLHTIPVARATGAMAHMMFPKQVLTTIEETLTLLQALRANTYSEKDARHRSRKSLNPAYRRFIDMALKVRCLEPSDPKDSWARLQGSEPCLTGEDLRSLGYKPGPLFTKIFDALREAKWEGKLRTRNEEIRFVKAGFSL